MCTVVILTRPVYGEKKIKKLSCNIDVKDKVTA